MYLVFTRISGESYRRRHRSLLLRLWDVFQALIFSLVRQTSQSGHCAVHCAVETSHLDKNAVHSAVETSHLGKNAVHSAVETSHLGIALCTVR